MTPDGTKPRFQYPPNSPDAGDQSSQHQQAAGPEALPDIARHLAELKEFVAYYIAANVDRVKLLLRLWGAMAVLGVIGLVVLICVVATAVWMTMAGISAGLGEWFGRPWLGDLIVGLTVLLGMTAGTLIGLKVWRASMKRKTIERYEQRQRSQQARFGTSVHQAAESPSRHA